MLNGLILFLSFTAIFANKTITNRADVSICDTIIDVPSVCSVDQMECQHLLDNHGCDVGSYCYPKSINDCDLACPPHCGFGEMFCGGVMGENGCPTEAECLPVVDPVTGCNNFCGINCDVGQERCDGLRVDHCTPAPYCASVGSCSPQTVYPDGCPILPEAESTCTPEETLCPMGKDIESCRVPDACKELATPHHAGCPAPDCPAACDLSFQQPCPRIFDINGCPETQVCKRYLWQCPKSKYTEVSGCPIQLSGGPVCNPTTEVLCLSNSVHIESIAPKDANLLEPKSICPMPSVCQAAFISQFGENRENKSNLSSRSALVRAVSRSDAPIGLCPNYCPPTCMLENDEMELVESPICDGLFESDGCAGPKTCKLSGTPCQPQTFDNSGCRLHEPKFCNSDEVLCDSLFDQNGCSQEQICISDNSNCACPPQEFDNKGCPLILLSPGPDCEATGEIQCPRNKDAKGCDTGHTCGGVQQADGCNEVCLPECSYPEQACMSEQDSEECTTKYTCEGPSANGCPVVQCPLAKCPAQLVPCNTFNNAGCPLLTCIESEEVCSSPFDPQGCTIHPPASCSEQQKPCPQGVDPYSITCLLADTCYPIEQDCPVLCNSNTDLTCSKGMYDGMPLGMTCIDFSTAFEPWPGSQCQVFCPAACDWKNQRACHGGFEFVTGCPLADFCLAVADKCPVHLDG